MVSAPKRIHGADESPQWAGNNLNSCKIFFATNKEETIRLPFICCFFDSNWRAIINIGGLQTLEASCGTFQKVLNSTFGTIQKRQTSVGPLIHRSTGVNDKYDQHFVVRLYAADLWCTEHLHLRQGEGKEDLLKAGLPPQSYWQHCFQRRLCGPQNCWNTRKQGSTKKT